MKITGNTILVTGGGSGIGRAFAEAFHKLGNQVIVAGRRQQVLDATTSANPGMASAVLDIEDPAAIKSFAESIVKKFPALNFIIHSAGIMRPEKLLGGAPELATAEAEITTNLLGPIRLNNALLPTIVKQPHGAIITITSGLAFVPMALTPTYCATKAAIHSYTQTLRFQLKDTKVEVIESIPPYVQTELMGPGQAADPRAMPLADFISETMEALKTEPTTTEIIVEKVKMLRFAEANGLEKYRAFFEQYNNAMMAPH